MIIGMPLVNLKHVGHGIAEMMDVLLEDFVLVPQATEHVLVLAEQRRLVAIRLHRRLPCGVGLSRPVHVRVVVAGPPDHDFPGVGPGRKFVRLRSRPATNTRTKITHIYSIIHK